VALRNSDFRRDSLLHGDTGNEKSLSGFHVRQLEQMFFEKQPDITIR
jgi:hypothetical protein